MEIQRSVTGRADQRRTMKIQRCKPHLIRLASLILLLAGSAVAFAIWFSSQDLERTLRRDLEISEVARMEILKEGTRNSPFEYQERYAWILVENGSKFELMGVARPVEGSAPWSIPLMTISWIDDQVGPDPFYSVFKGRPSQAEINDFIRYSEGF